MFSTFFFQRTSRLNRHHRSSCPDRSVPQVFQWRCFASAACGWCPVMITRQPNLHKGSKMSSLLTNSPTHCNYKHLASAGYRCQAVPTPLKPSGCGPDVKRSISRKIQMLCFSRPLQGKLCFCLKYFLNLDCFATPSLHVKLWDRLLTATENEIQLELIMFSKTRICSFNVSLLALLC